MFGIVMFGIVMFGIRALVQQTIPAKARLNARARWSRIPCT
jgi:hypothetical protein